MRHACSALNEHVQFHDCRVPDGRQVVGCQNRRMLVQDFTWFLCILDAFGCCPRHEHNYCRRRTRCSVRHQSHQLRLNATAPLLPHDVPASTSLIQRITAMSLHLSGKSATGAHTAATLRILPCSEAAVCCMRFFSNILWQFEAPRG